MMENWNRFSRQTQACSEITQTRRSDRDPIRSGLIRSQYEEAEDRSRRAAPRKVIRADKAPTTGYSLVVDGHFKSHHDTVEAAEEAGMALKNKFPMLQVQVYDAATKTRSMVQWPVPA